MILSKPLKELGDTELLNLLDQVSDEVKRRNSLVVESDGVEDSEALRRAVSAFADVMRAATGR